MTGHFQTLGDVPPYRNRDPAGGARLLLTPAIIIVCSDRHLNLGQLLSLNGLWADLVLNELQLPWRWLT